MLLPWDGWLCPIPLHDTKLNQSTSRITWCHQLIFNLNWLIGSDAASLDKGQVKMRINGCIRGLLSQCAPAFGLALQTAIVPGVNFDRKLMYDSQWGFLPISTMHIIVTQLLVTIPSQCVETSAMADVASMFQLLPMSKWDCDEVFGMKKSFYDALPKLPDIAEASCPDVVSIIQGMCDFAVFDS